MSLDGRMRFQFRFHLDVTKALEHELAEQLDALKQRRLFKPWIRDALRLFFSLKDGDISVLQELFPGIVAQIQEQRRGDNGGNDNAVSERLATIEGLLLRQENGKPEMVSLPKLPAPVFADDAGDTLVMKPIQDGHSAHNFMASVQALASG